MKKLLFFILISLTVNQLAEAQTESIDRFIRKYKRSATGDKVDITVPGWLVRFGINFIDDKDLEGVDIQAIARKVSNIRIVSIEGGAKIPSSDIQNLMDDARAPAGRIHAACVQSSEPCRPVHAFRPRQ